MKIMYTITVEAKKDCIGCGKKLKRDIDVYMKRITKLIPDLTRDEIKATMTINEETYLKGGE